MLKFDVNQVMGEGEEHGVVKIADFGLARIYQAPLKPLCENGVKMLSFKLKMSLMDGTFPFLFSPFMFLYT